MLLALLFAANVVNYVDRQIVTILQEPIKADLGLSDTQLGLLTGLSFALFYATMGLPIARLADRFSRSRIIAGSIAIWSAMTALCAAAGSFSTLLLCRIGVGVGEAGLSPSAHSLISDTFEPRRRGTALGIYSAGIQVGVMLGFLLGGYIHSHFGWRTAFVVVGAPGLLLAMIFRLLVPEPPRGRFDPPPLAHPAPDAPGQALGSLWQNRPFRLAALACGFHAVGLYGIGHWVPPYLARAHAMPIGDIALWLATLAVTCGALGIWVSGLVADRADAARPGGGLRIAMWSVVLLIPCEVVFVLAPSAAPALTASALVHFLGGFYLAPAISFAHARVAPEQRATASAVLLLSINLIGLGLGPLGVGALSDILTTKGDAGAGLRMAMLAVVPAQLVAIAAFHSALRAARLPRGAHETESHA